MFKFKQSFGSVRFGSTKLKLVLRTFVFECIHLLRITKYRHNHYDQACLNHHKNDSLRMGSFHKYLSYNIVVA